MEINHIHVFDIDGTFIDSSHRYKSIVKNGVRSIDLQHWIDNEHMTEFDTFLPLISHVKELLSRPDKYVIFATARACVKGDETYKFLERHGLKPDLFIHRQGRKDTRGGAELKIHAIKPLLEFAFKDIPVTVYEDNKKYLLKMCKALNAIPFYNPSNQGF